MPLFGKISHSNRSSQALDNHLQAQRASPTDSPAPQPPSADHNVYDLRNPPSQLYSQAPSEVPQSFIPVTNLQEAEFRPYSDAQADVLPRSPSLRYPPSFPQPQPPTQPLQTEDRPISAPNEQHYAGDLRKSYSVGPGPSTRGQPAPERKSIGRFFGLGKGSKADDQQAASTQQLSLNSIGAVTRRVSKRYKDPSTESRILGPNNSSGEPLQLNSDWQQGHSSEYHLPSPHEAEEKSDDIDPYLIPQDDLGKAQNLDYDPRILPQNQVGRADQDLSLRAVDDSQMRQTYQQQQSNFPPQQQHPLLLAPVSPANTQGGDYHQQLLQYQAHQSQQGDLNPSSLQLRSGQNPEVVSQLSHDSPTESIDEQAPPSMQGTGPSQSGNAGYGASTQEHPVRTTSIQGPRPLAPPSAMSQPPPPPAQSRKSVETKQPMQGDNRGPPPPAYSQQQFSGPNPGNAGGGSGGQLQQMGGGSQSGNYRSAALQREYQQGPGDQGRSTPPLADNRESELEVFKAKYKKVKGLYFEKLGQVEQLQNTLANQRLSLSRTSLDDNEYATRFGRLDGAIKEIAYSIRKDWTTIPRWLTSFVNQDAPKVGTKEMTAVGRAFISRWIFDEIFQKCFHPGLDVGLSLELKRIEQTIRLVAAPATSKEEVEALDSKVVQWKLTTVEGLGNRLSSPKCADEKAAFTQKAVSNLTAHLLNHLQNSSIQSIEGNATSIVEIAVFIASHIPLESRDICITYPLPGDPVVSHMKVELPLPLLQNPGVDSNSEADAPGDQADSADAAADAEASKDGPAKLTKKQEKPKATLASGSLNGKRQPAATEAEQKEGTRVRFAGFMGIEVRGRHSLVPAPVWTM